MIHNNNLKKRNAKLRYVKPLVRMGLLDLF